MANVMPSLCCLGGHRGALMPGSAGCFSFVAQASDNMQARKRNSPHPPSWEKFGKDIDPVGRGKKKHRGTTPKKVSNGLREERVESARLTGEGMVGGNLWF